MMLPTMGTGHDRTEGIISRSGIISQFELWKKYARERRYPTDGKSAKTHSELGRFIHVDERTMLEDVIQLRNRMTHEPDHEDDPSIRDLVDFCNKLHHLAGFIDRLHKSGLTATWRPPSQPACKCRTVQS